MVLVDKNDDEHTKKLLILDFIALLVSALQSQQQTLEAIGRRGEEHQNTTSLRLSALEHGLERVWTEMSQLKKQLQDEQCCVRPSVPAGARLASGSDALQ